jgi:hypothetical protein
MTISKDEMIALRERFETLLESMFVKMMILERDDHWFISISNTISMNISTDYEISKHELDQTRFVTVMDAVERVIAMFQEIKHSP